MTINYKTFTKIVVLVAVASTLINLVLTYVGRMISSPPTAFAPYMYSTVTMLTIVGVVGAGVVYLVMRKYFADVARANHLFLILSAIVLVVSFYPDVMLPYSTDSDQVGWTYGIMANLMLMHVVAGALVMYYFVRPERS